MLISRLVALSLALGLLPSASSADCKARDFMALPFPDASSRSALSEALEAAYPGLKVDEATQTVVIGQRKIAVGADKGKSARDRLTHTSIRDQFEQVYPLGFDLEQRRAPWFDPGRARSDAFFRALYGETEAQVARSLASARYQSARKNARFAVNTRQCVVQQLQAALDAIAAEGDSMDRFFDDVGGSFNWRTIAGTNRLSAHSFGIAVDFNTRLGGYWRWAGATEGSVGPYDNQYPESLVHHMERFGFIWGGKWHHYDGMHFEYRPELILYARRIAEKNGG